MSRTEEIEKEIATLEWRLAQLRAEHDTINRVATERYREALRNKTSG